MRKTHQTIKSRRLQDTGLRTPERVKTKPSVKETCQTLEKSSASQSNQILSTDMVSSPQSHQNEFKNLIEKIEILKLQCQQTERDQQYIQEEFQKREDVYKQVIMTLENRLEQTKRQKSISQTDYGTKQFFQDCKLLIEENEELRKQIINLCTRLQQKDQINDQAQKSIAELKRQLANSSKRSISPKQQRFFSTHTPNETQQLDYFEECKMYKKENQALQDKLKIQQELNQGLQKQNQRLENQIKDGQFRYKTNQSTVRQVSPPTSRSPNRSAITSEYQKSEYIKKLEDEFRVVQAKLNNEIANVQNLENALNIKQAHWDLKEQQLMQQQQNLEAVIVSKERQIIQIRVKHENNNKLQETNAKQRDELAQFTKQVAQLKQQLSNQMKQIASLNTENLELQEEVNAMRSRQQSMQNTQRANIFVEQMIDNRVRYYEKQKDQGKIKQSPKKTPIFSGLLTVTEDDEEEDDDIESVSSVEMVNGEIQNKLQKLEETVKEITEIEHKKEILKIQEELKERDETIQILQKQLTQQKPKKIEQSQADKVVESSEQLGRSLEIARQAINDTKLRKETKQDRMDVCINQLLELDELYTREATLINREMTDRLNYLSIFRTLIIQIKFCRTLKLSGSRIIKYLTPSTSTGTLYYKHKDNTQKSRHFVT